MPYEYAIKDIYIFFNKQFDGIPVVKNLLYIKIQLTVFIKRDLQQHFWIMIYMINAKTIPFSRMSLCVVYTPNYPFTPPE